MKILIINKYLYPKGGSETYIFRLGEVLKAHGHEVQYFGMEHDRRCVGNAVNAYTTDMDFHGGSKLKKLTYPVKTIYSVEARKKIRLVLDDFQPDVCHLNNFNYQLTPSVILEIRKWEKETGHRIRIVYTAHDYQLVCPNHMMRNPVNNRNCEKCLGGNFFHCICGRCIHKSAVKSCIGAMEAFFWRMRETYKQLDIIVCPSEFMKSVLDRNRLLKDKTVALLNFADLNQPQKAVKKNYILYFGRLSEEKGIRTLISACRELPDIPFVIAGEGPLEQELHSVSNIQYVGFQYGDVLKTLIREALFTVYPSEYYENCPFSILESLTCGTPVLGADIGGIPELISIGQTGELFESGNRKDLISKIKKMWENREMLESYSEQCKELHFDTVELYYEKIIKIYDDVWMNKN